MDGDKGLGHQGGDGGRKIRTKWTVSLPGRSETSFIVASGYQRAPGPAWKAAIEGKVQTMVRNGLLESLAGIPKDAFI